jgi:hypothetical protein
VECFIFQASIALHKIKIAFALPIWLAISKLKLWLASSACTDLVILGEIFVDYLSHSLILVTSNHLTINTELFIAGRASTFNKFSFSTFLHYN